MLTVITLELYAPTVTPTGWSLMVVRLSSQKDCSLHLFKRTVGTSRTVSTIRIYGFDIRSNPTVPAHELSVAFTLPQRTVQCEHWPSLDFRPK